MPPVVIQITIALGVGAMLFWFRSSRRSKRPIFGFPLAHRPGEDPTRSWIFHGQEVVKEALKKVHSQSMEMAYISVHLVIPSRQLTNGQYSGPFQVMTPTGPKIILPNRYARDVGTSPIFNLPMAFGSVCQNDLMWRFG